MFRGCIVKLILVFGILTAFFCYPKDSFAQQDIQTVEGRLSAIDTFKSTITVKSLLLDPIIVYKDVTLFVGPDTKLMRQGDTISIFDLTMGSPVSVKYVDKIDTPEALSITVTK